MASVSRRKGRVIASVPSRPTSNATATAIAAPIPGRLHERGAELSLGERQAVPGKRMLAVPTVRPATTMGGRGECRKSPRAARSAVSHPSAGTEAAAGTGHDRARYVTDL